MTATAPDASSELVPAGEPCLLRMSGPLAGFLAGYCGLTRGRIHPGPAAVHVLARRARAAPVHRPPGGYRVLRPRHGDQRSDPNDHSPPPAHDRGFYRYVVEEYLFEHSPAAHVHRPRLDYGSHAVGLDLDSVRLLGDRRGAIHRCDARRFSMRRAACRRQGGRTAHLGWLLPAAGVGECGPSPTRRTAREAGRDR